MANIKGVAVGIFLALGSVLYVITRISLDSFIQLFGQSIIGMGNWLIGFGLETTLLNITSGSILFLICEVIVNIIFVKDEGGWKFRFGSIEDFPNLNPYISTSIVALVILLMAVFIPQLTSLYLWDKLILFISSFKFWILLAPSIWGFSYLWILYMIVEKNFDMTDIDQIIALIVTILSFVVFAYLNFVIA